MVVLIFLPPSPVTAMTPREPGYDTAVILNNTCLFHRSTKASRHAADFVARLSLFYATAGVVVEYRYCQFFTTDLGYRDDAAGARLRLRFTTTIIFWCDVKYTLIHPIIRCFFGNLHVMHMAFAYAGRGNFYELRPFVHF